MSIETILEEKDWYELLHKRLKIARSMVQGYEGLITRYEEARAKGPTETYIENGHLHFRLVGEIKPPYKTEVRETPPTLKKWWEYGRKEQEEYPHL